MGSHIFASSNPTAPPVNKIRRQDKIFLLNTDTKVCASNDINVFGGLNHIYAKLLIRWKLLLRFIYWQILVEELVGELCELHCGN